VSFIDRDVLIIDDILDEGHTLSAIIDLQTRRRAQSAHRRADRQGPRPQGASGSQGHFVGLPCVDRYIFGYGMDYKGYWRNANGFCR
jgi:hypoxanthine phosphoribosyltransferase